MSFSSCLFFRTQFVFWNSGMTYDSMCGVQGPYALRFFEKELGAPMGTSKNATPQPDFGGPDSAWHGHADPNLTYAVELVKDMGLNKALRMGFQEVCMRCLCKNHQKKKLVKASWRVSCKGMIIIILIHPSIQTSERVNFVPFGAGGQQGGHREAHSMLRCRGRRRCGSQHDLRCPVLRVTQRLLGHDCGQRASHPTVTWNKGFP